MASKDLVQELRALIERELPTIEAKRFQAYIAEAEKTKVDLEQAQQTIASLQGQVNDITKQRVALQEKLTEATNQLAAYRTREADIKDAEHKILTARHEAAVAEGKRIAALEVVAMFTKNPEIRRDVQLHHSRYVSGPQGSSNDSRSETGTVTTKEE